MKYRVLASWLIDSSERDVHSGDAARECAQAMISGDADFPDSVSMSVFEAAPGDTDEEPHDLVTLERVVSAGQMFYQLPPMRTR